MTNYVSYKRRGNSTTLDAKGYAGLAILAFAVSCFGAWITHLVWVIGKLASDQGVTVGQVALGVIGAFMPPVGVVHGFMIWFGAGF